MVKTVVVPSVRGGVVAAVILGLGRALGEAIAVTQVIGNFIPLKLLDLRARRHAREPGREPVPGRDHEHPDLVADLPRADPARDHVHHELRRAADRQALRVPAERAVADERAGISPACDRPLPAAACSSTASPRQQRWPPPRSRSRRSAIVVWSVGSRGVGALNWDFFTKGPRARSARRAAASRRRSSASLLLVRDRDRDRPPDRRADCDLRQRVRAAASRRAGSALARRAERLPVDRDRHLRLHALREGRSCRWSAGVTTRARSPAASRSRSSCCRSSRARRWKCCRLVPNQLREASYALGVSKWQTVLRVVLPTSFGGILTGTTLAVARAAGETAPLLFTCAIAGQIVDWNPTHSVQSIPLTIFQYSESADPNLHAAGVGGGVRPDHVRARDKPDRRDCCSSARGASSA